MTQALAGRILKGLYATAVSVLGTLTTLLVGSAHFSDLTDGQWVSLGLFGLVAFGGTFGLSGWSGPTAGTNGK